MTGRGCKSMRRLISASLDGELSPEDEQILQAHLDSCAECRQVREVYRANRSLIQHNLPANSDPPSFVSDEILRRTREISNSHGLRRLILGSRLRLTMSVVATIAIVIIASAFFLVQNYRAGIPPSIAGFQPNPTQEVDFLKPVTITFNHPMNDASVMSNLVMSQQQAYFIGDGYYHWDGSSLVIGVGKNGQTRPFTPASVYTIWVMAAAKDANGNPLGGNGWTVSFRTTSATKFASGTPAATPSPTPTSPSVAEATGPTTTTESGPSKTQTPDANSVPSSNTSSQSSTGTAQNQLNGSTHSATGTPDATPVTGAGNLDGSHGQTTPRTDGTAGTQTTSPPPSGVANESNSNAPTNTANPPVTNGTQSTPATTPSAAAIPVTPTATPSSTVTGNGAGTGTVAVATPAGTTTPANESTGTVTATTTSTATQSAAAGNANDTTAASSTSISKCAAVSPTLKMAGAFGSVYYPNVSVCTKLGQPQGDSTTAQTSILTFQRGVMIERADTKKVYVLASNGTGGNYQVFDAPSPSLTDNGGTPASGDNLWIPGGDLGKVWKDNNLVAQIGDATSQTADSSTATPVQAFQNGSMIYSDAGFVYVLYNDNTWQVYPDTSGHGALLTPTATAPSPTGTSSSTAAP